MTRTYSVGIITAPRHPSTLEATLESVRAAGWLPTVYHQQPVAPIDWAYTVPHAGEGCYQNWLFALRSMTDEYAVGERPPDYVLIFEDDCEVTPELRDWLDAQSLPWGVLSLYCAAHADNGNGWLQPPLRGSYGALAYLLPFPIAYRLALDPLWPDRPGGTDHNVLMWCKRTGTPYYVHAPSFVRHTGDVSTQPAQGVEANRQCKRFVRRIEKCGRLVT